MSAPALSVRLTGRIAVLSAGLLVRSVRAASRVLRPARHRSRSAVLAIGAGARGWELLEYQELLASAQEFLGDGAVRTHTVADPERYPLDVRDVVRDGSITHYFHDPRTGMQDSARALGQSVRIALILAWAGVTPISRLPDFAVRRWRLQSALVTAGDGVCLVLMSPRVVADWFPHRRLVGPMPMALSNGRVRMLRAARDERGEHRPRAVFNGSTYEPRTSFLAEVRTELRGRGLELEIEARELGSARATPDVIWADYGRADILITTAFQTTGQGIDDMDAFYLTYRYFEALAVGALLVAPIVPGVEVYLRPGEDFAAYSTAQEAADVVAFYLGHDEARLRIARLGRDRVAELTRSHVYWTTINLALGARALRPVGS